MTILVTGGTGYIGSHTCVELMNAGADVVILDNLCNSRAEVIGRIASITGRQSVFVQGDVRDAVVLDSLFSQHKITAVLHFAGLKSPSESVSEPLAYYDNNVHGSLALLQAMSRHGVRRLVFSSTANVYGCPPSLPIKEDFPLQVTNPYGRSKLMVEEILRDLAVADPQWRVAILRYFNPVGAHPSGLIGEAPNGIPNNLVPYIGQVAGGLRSHLSVFGDDYPTPDGTGIRDYIHVVDLAIGHLRALQRLDQTTGAEVYNLGTGQGYSVMEVVKAFEKACGKKIPCSIALRRAGDVAVSYADPSRAREILGWRATRTLDEMCADAWRWQLRFYES